MVEKQRFASSYFLRILKKDYNPFTPNVLYIDDKHIEYRRRNWYLISVDTETFHFQDVAGVLIDKHLFGASIDITTIGGKSIIIHGFWKRKANAVRDLCLEYIDENTQRGAMEVMTDAISDAVKKSGGIGGVSVADELKKMKELLDSGVISQDEFDDQKANLLD